MGKVNIVELLKKAKELQDKQAEIKKQLADEKKLIVAEYTSGMDTAEINKAIQEAEAELMALQLKEDKLKAEYTEKLNAIKDEKELLKDRLDLFGYTQKNSLPRIDKPFEVSGNEVVIRRKEFGEIKINFLESQWEKKLIAELEKNGLPKQAESRIIDNVVYKAQLAVKAFLAK